MPIKSVMLSNHLILCCLLLLLPSIFPRTRIFSNELALHVRWPKYWSFSFSNNPSNEYSGLISFRFSSAQLCPTLCNPMDCSTPGFPVHHQLLELAQTHVHHSTKCYKVYKKVKYMNKHSLKNQHQFSSAQLLSHV